MLAYDNPKHPRISHTKIRGFGIRFVEGTSYLSATVIYELGVYDDPIWTKEGEGHVTITDTSTNTPATTFYQTLLNSTQQNVWMALFESTVIDRDPFASEM